MIAEGRTGASLSFGEPMTRPRCAPLRAFLATLCFALAAFLAPVGVLRAQSAPSQPSALQRAQIEQIVKSYLLAHPEVIQDALNALAQKQQAQDRAQAKKAVAEHRQALFDSPHQEVIGNPKGKVTLVEFFDYNCPHCRNVIGDIGRLMKANPDLRIVLKDFAILTPQSVRAARVAIAMRSQFHGERFWKWHKALMTSAGLVGQAQALAEAKKMGANMPLLEKDLKGPEPNKTLKEVGALATDIHAEGTPTFVLGDSVYPGEMTFDQLNPLIAAVRQCGKTKCA